MSEPTPTPPNTYRRRCRRCGQEVIETATAFGRVARFDAAPDAAGDVRFLPDGTAVYLGRADAANARAAGVPLYAAHNPHCKPACVAPDLGGEG